ncbi:MAG TPA: type II toxin-antitoxin system RelE/ParE family toxin [Desulfuromonadales bacterium]|nr:type II toxin-antitoxin system RelE/ParE family toxin [Desulfuromonadales bacterium]
MIYKTRHFNRWAGKTSLSDDLLLRAVEEMTNGLIDADLGGGVFKKRIALPGRGKSGSARTLLATNRDDRWIFILGYEKNERANISDKERDALRMVAKDLLGLSAGQLQKTVNEGALVEVCYEKE